MNLTQKLNKCKHGADYHNILKDYFEFITNNYNNLPLDDARKAAVMLYSIVNTNMKIQDNERFRSTFSTMVNFEKILNEKGIYFDNELTSVMLKKIESIKEKEMMFDEKPHFQEIFDDPEYFLTNKEGLKAAVIYISPYDYMDAVKNIYKEHKTSKYKLDSLKDAYEQGIKVPMPYLRYGERDISQTMFGQEGFNRAYTASMVGKELIPVSIRYRDNDSTIPTKIKKAIDLAELAITLKENSNDKKEILVGATLDKSDLNISFIKKDKKIYLELEKENKSILIESFLSSKISPDLSHLTRCCDTFLNLANLGRDLKTKEDVISFVYSEPNQISKNQIDEAAEEAETMKDYLEKATYLLGSNFSYCEIGEELDDLEKEFNQKVLIDINKKMEDNELFKEHNSDVTISAMKELSKSKNLDYK